MTPNMPFIYGYYPKRKKKRDAITLFMNCRQGRETSFISTLDIAVFSAKTFFHLKKKLFPQQRKKKSSDTIRRSFYLADYIIYVTSSAVQTIVF